MGARWHGLTPKETSITGGMGDRYMQMSQLQLVCRTYHAFWQEKRVITILLAVVSSSSTVAMARSQISDGEHDPHHPVPEIYMQKLLQPSIIALRYDLPA